jgi:hypothetical protein
MFRRKPKKLVPSERAYVIQYIGSIAINARMTTQEISNYVGKAGSLITDIDADGLLSTLTITPQDFTFRLAGPVGERVLSYDITNVACISIDESLKCCCGVRTPHGPVTIHVFDCHLAKSLIEFSKLTFQRCVDEANTRYMLPTPVPGPCHRK